MAHLSAMHDVHLYWRVPTDDVGVSAATVVVRPLYDCPAVAHDGTVIRWRSEGRGSRLPVSPRALRDFGASQGAPGAARGRSTCLR